MEAVAGREDAIEVTLTLDEPGTAYCALVRSGLVAPSHYVVTAAGPERREDEVQSAGKVVVKTHSFL